MRLDYPLESFTYPRVLTNSNWQISHFLPLIFAPPLHWPCWTRCLSSLGLITIQVRAVPLEAEDKSHCSPGERRKYFSTANSLSKQSRMVRSIGQKLSARTIDMKWVTTEIPWVSNIICKPDCNRKKEDVIRVQTYLAKRGFLTGL